MSQWNPVIVVVAFNRPHSLERLLNSLKRARNIENAKLIISIDNLEPHNLHIKKIADAFTWPFGEKEVIYQKQRLGLRNHIIQCGDLSEKYGSVIILEDDLFVSPFFYDYAQKALAYYDIDDKIGGISLYKQPYEETHKTPFNPIDDNSSVFFIQFPSSLGQAWTYRQWKLFRDWYNKSQNLALIPVPPKVLNWPETSWKKYFCAFLVQTNGYFVYPRISLTTNFNDPGTNMKKLVNHDGQVQLQLVETNYKFRSINESQCIYDVFFELLPSSLISFTNQFNQYDLELDLYGNKDLSKIKSSYVITSHPAKNYIAGFKRALKPHELNVILNLAGKDFFLCNKEDVLPFTKLYEKKIADYQYFYHKNLNGWKVLVTNYLIKMKSKIFFS